MPKAAHACSATAAGASADRSASTKLSMPPASAMASLLLPLFAATFKNSQVSEEQEYGVGPEFRRFWLPHCNEMHTRHQQRTDSDRKHQGLRAPAPSRMGPRQTKTQIWQHNPIPARFRMAQHACSSAAGCARMAAMTKGMAEARAIASLFFSLRRAMLPSAPHASFCRPAWSGCSRSASTRSPIPPCSRTAALLRSLISARL